MYIINNLKYVLIVFFLLLILTTDVKIIHMIKQLVRLSKKRITLYKIKV